MNNIITLILAAGKGTRMQSDLPKVLHSVGNLPLVGHVVHTAETLCRKIGVVISPSMASYGDDIKKMGRDIHLIVQQEQRGTAHAYQRRNAWHSLQLHQGVFCTIHWYASKGVSG